MTSGHDETASEPSPSPVSGEGPGRGMRASQIATPAFLTARARDLRQNETDAERMLWGELRDGRLNGFRFVRQFVVKPYIADFACRRQRLIVELDGSQHAASRYDVQRTRVLNDAGWSVLRFWNEEALGYRSDVLDTILAAVLGNLAACDGAGLLEGLRFAPGRPSPTSLRSAPSPACGRGEAPLHELPTDNAPPSSVAGDLGRGMRASKAMTSIEVPS